MQKCKNIYTLFFVQMLMVIYTAFFATQVFSINNDTGANAGTTTCLFAAKDRTTSAKSHQNKHTPGKQRLNKRFQPESWLYTAPIQIVYNKYIPPVNKPLFFYRNGFVPSFLFIAQTLRGPPVMA
ncbi:hypothetical protein ACTHGU_02950 [Chitinophagaceae bacterium MMS25-I14]